MFVILCILKVFGGKFLFQNVHKAYNLTGTLYLYKLNGSIYASSIYEYTE